MSRFQGGMFIFDRFPVISCAKDSPALARKPHINLLGIGECLTPLSPFCKYLAKGKTKTLAVFAVFC